MPVPRPSKLQEYLNEHLVFRNGRLMRKSKTTYMGNQSEKHRRREQRLDASLHKNGQVEENKAAKKKPKVIYQFLVIYSGEPTFVLPHEWVERAKERFHITSLRQVQIIDIGLVFIVKPLRRRTNRNRMPLRGDVEPTPQKPETYTKTVSVRGHAEKELQSRDCLKLSRRWKRRVDKKYGEIKVVEIRDYGDKLVILPVPPEHLYECPPDFGESWAARDSKHHPGPVHGRQKKPWIIFDPTVHPAGYPYFRDIERPAHRPPVCSHSTKPLPRCRWCGSTKIKKAGLTADRGYQIYRCKEPGCNHKRTYFVREKEYWQLAKEEQAKNLAKGSSHSLAPVAKEIIEAEKERVKIGKEQEKERRASFSTIRSAVEPLGE